MLVSSVQQSDSHTHIYIDHFSDSVPLYDRLLQDIEYSTLCYTRIVINNRSICETHDLGYYIKKFILLAVLLSSSWNNSSA